MSNKLPKKRNNNQLCISVDSGKIEVPIIDKHTHEKLGQLVFAPNDTNIVERYEEVVSFWKNYKMPEEDSLEAVKKAEKEISDQLSYLINADAEKAFFSILGPFSPMDDGKIFMEQVLDGVAQVIEKTLNANVTKVQRRVNKYVAKYHN
jgi:hypothetical protein